MDKRTLDRWFSENYNHLNLAAKKTKLKYNNQAIWEPEEMVSEAYSHVVKFVEDLTTDSEIESYFMKFMHSNTVWANSAMNKVYKENKNLEFIPSYQALTHIPYEDELAELIEEENFREGYKALLSMFHKTLNTQEKIIFEKIFIEGNRTLKELRKEVKTNTYYLQKQRAELYSKLKEFGKQYREKWY